MAEDLDSKRMLIHIKGTLCYLEQFWKPYGHTGKNTDLRNGCLKVQGKEDISRQEQQTIFL